MAGVYDDHAMEVCGRKNRMRHSWIFNDDLTTNILCRLPAKTLHIVKFVSHEWCNLISSHSFIRQQLKKMEPVSGFFFQETFEWIDVDDVDPVSYIPVDVANPKVHRGVLDFLPEEVAILSSNNGLLCCRGSFSACQPTLYVCNPLNKQWTGLEWPNCCLRNCSVSLVFDPFKNHLIDESTNFKLVAVSDNVEVDEEEEEHCFFFDIYSSKTASWRRLKESCKCDHGLYKKQGVFVEGVLYWLTHGYQILVFDSQTELPKLITTPIHETEFSSIPSMCLGESQDKLCYVIISEIGLQFWVLEDCHTYSWVLKISRTLDELEMENPSVLYNISERVGNCKCLDSVAWMDPLAFQDGTLLLRVSANVYSYQFDVRRMKKLCNISALGPKSMFSSIVVPYSMSLVPQGGAVPDA